MSSIKALGYVGVRAARPSDWVELATNLVGMQLATFDEQQAVYRVDDRAQRFTVVQGQGGGLAFLGWEVDSAAALQQLCEQLNLHQVSWRHGSDELTRQRAVSELIEFSDPLGNRLEAFWGGLKASTPFEPGRTLSGFVTGGLGVGHIALTVAEMEPTLSFYRDVLQFETSDWVVRPFAVHFFHVNSRHHSFALVNTGKNGVHHLMLELRNLDDVGQAYDRALQTPGSLSVTLGRHTNDYMTSFYLNTPSNFLLEYGWGGLNIETDGWQSRELVEGPSFWGHERSWLPPEGRAEALRMRMKAADDGVRAPVQVLPGNHRVTSPD